ncbi:hypothetical protein QUB80_04090 [Chlorogloeopsis sp. ULAP01]|uniref:hypothetical protein n=1 Tax=Chlorogloeopsis sp. ULAP01 TaxID=3056483 RepID=UPI0025AA3810|nr:hypothetical protein [Chlorogloeopsis sp. ULAP01]MDM9379878.1 hypothetical protein [Chlorogloeopsis sp. ULAP01]
MKRIKLFLFCAISAISFAFSAVPAQAQSQPLFCQIHEGNLSSYVSEYNIFDKSSRTPLRPFIQNSKTYKIDKNLTAKPLFFTTASDGSIVSAFQLKGVIGNLSIGTRDVVTQYIQ